MSLIRIKLPFGKRIAIIFDYDLTMTEEFQQVPYLQDNFRAIQKEYDGRK